MRKIYHFHGGVHPPEHKTASVQQPILTLPLPSRLVVPLCQSIGSVPKCLVRVGEQVKKGQKIAAAEGRVSVAVHAPSSGVVTDIGDYVVAHPSGLTAPCIVIIPDGCDEWIAREPIDFSRGESDDICRYLQEMGVVGLGGAVFPSHLKLNKKDLETLVINGAECEPYITCDDVLMRERADEILAGIALLRQLLKPKEILIGIEDNKPEAIAAMRRACEVQGNIAEVVVVPTCYPSGGAKQLIKLLTNKEVPRGSRSTDLGVQCLNVATVYTIYRALRFAEPVLSRIVTVTGNVHEAANYEVLIGTPLDEMVWRAAPKEDTDGYIMGGPMMGLRVLGMDVPISKASNCFIATSPSLFPAPQPALPCIRCGECARACPVQLQPQDLYWFAKAKNMGKAQEWSLFDCIECGACAYVCPSQIPLVDYYRFAKSEIWAAEAQQKSAAQARERHEFRMLRIAREKVEKATRLAAKKATKHEGVANSDSLEHTEHAALIQAAMLQAAEKKAHTTTLSSTNPSAGKATPDNVAHIAAKETALASPTLLTGIMPSEGDSALDNLDVEKIRHISQTLRKKAKVAVSIDTTIMHQSEKE